MIFSACLCGPLVAHGQGAPDTGLTRAQTYVELAEALYRAKDYAGALEEFRRALPLAEEEEPRAIIQLNIAQCLLKLGQKADAVEAFETYLELDDDETRQDKIRRKVAELAREAFGHLNIKCGPDGATVHVPDVFSDAAQCPWEARMRLGEYTVTVTRDGFTPEERRVEIKPGVEVSLQFSLKPQAEAPPPSRQPPPPARDDLYPLLTAGVGGALLLTGAGFTLAALDTRDGIDGALDSPSTRGRQDTYDGQVAASYVLYGLGGAALLGGLAWWYFGDDEPAPGASVIVGPGSVGFRW